MKKRIVTIVVVLVGFVGILLAAHVLVPPILKSERHALLSGHMMLITMKKQGTTDLITFPVDYLRDGNSVYVGSDSGWVETPRRRLRGTVADSGNGVGWLGHSNC